MKDKTTFGLVIKKDKKFDWLPIDWLKLSKKGSLRLNYLFNGIKQRIIHF
jgi:hypothetical protein